MEYHSGGSLPLLGRPRYCPGANANGGYLCETGHCCGETGCCTYYYELWWFWLLWTFLILFSCCCAYRHRRAKLRVQQQQRQREISLLAYHGANSYPSSMLDLSFLASLKLPSYEEVAAQPTTPPPPYSSVFTTPRYPQPPRTTDPHLLTQHGPMLHRPLSDGPSSLSSDNSSSCSCDSCCPSSPCSSSLSAPITYETDTSHATTPSEAAPLALDVTMETIAAAATCLEVNESRLVSERMVDVGGEDAAEAHETSAVDSPLPNQAVTVAVVTRAASPQRPPSPEVALTIVTAPQLHQEPRSQSAGSPPMVPSPGLVDATLPPVLVMSAEGPEMTPDPKTTSMSDPPTPTASTSDSPRVTPTLEALDLTRTLETATLNSAPTPDLERTLIRSSPSPPTPDQSPSLVANLTPEPVPSNRTQAPEPLLVNLTHVPEPLPTTSCPDPVTLVPNPQPKIYLSPDSEINQILQHADSFGARAPPGSGLDQVPPSPGLPRHPVALNAPALVLPEPETDHVGPAPSGSSPGSGSVPGSTPPVPCASCPAITVESESLFTQSPPVAASPSSPPLLPSPSLLLDPLTARHQSNKGGSSSGHASSLSPSPRATQSPPKQTLFSPCVDVFEPGPPSWEDGDEEPEEDGGDEDEDEDMGADESQYRHRRLTGDSGIEVCRCRVEEEEEEEEEEEKEGGGGGGGGVEGEKKGSGNEDLHDSADCPVRGQVTAGEGLILGTATAKPDDKVVIVMETM